MGGGEGGREGGSNKHCLLSLFSSPVQSTGRAIVVTLASALALAFPSRHF